MVLGCLSRSFDTFSIQGCHLLWPDFPDRSDRYQITPEHAGAYSRKIPRPRICNASRLSHTCGLGWTPFARRYSGYHCYFLFLRLLRCFSSPGSLLNPMDSGWDDMGLTMPGFPIRKSPDLRLFRNSPKLIAAYHVLHRLLAPRHPPSALISLTTILMAKRLAYYSLKILKLCSLLDAIQFSKNQPTDVNLLPKKRSNNLSSAFQRTTFIDPSKSISKYRLYFVSFL